MIKLDAPESYKKASSSRKAKICNGVGAAFFPAWLTDILNRPTFCYGVSLRPAADIHDWEYHYGKTTEDKITADKRFGDNCRTLVKAVIPWYLPLRRFAALARTKECYLAVRYGGDRAFWSNKD